MAKGGIKFCQLITGINNKTLLPGDISLTFFPNPTDSELNILYDSRISTKAELAIYDSKGRMVKKLSTNTEIGSNKLTINIADLQTATGLHVLRLTLNEKSYKQNFVIVK